MSEQLEQAQIEILEETFAKLADNGDKLVERFYMELFKRYPEVRPMFEGVDQKEQEKKLLASLALVVNNIRKPEVLGPALNKLGKNHQKYGAVAEHYSAVAETLLDVMSEFAGELWTEEVQQAWTNALNTVAKAMLEAYEDSEDKTMSNDDVDELRKELQKMQVAVEGAQTAMIMVDRDFKVTYINRRTQEMLKEHRDVFASVWPGFDPDKIMGACIDMFHKNPAHQRQLLSDPNNLPYETDIEIGDLKFSLTVSAQIDPDGNYIGNTLEWLDVTELRKKENDQARLQVAVDGCQSPMIMIDRDFIITYANDATVQLLTKYQDKFKEVWPSFNIDGLMGTCIDVFHKNPAHQRQLLSNPINLPYKTDIDVNGLKFSLTVSAQMDAQGNYIGNTLEWQDVTELRQTENEQARLQVAVDGCQSAMVMINRDFEVTYANNSTIELMKKYESKFKEVWPSFSADKLMGMCIDVFHKNPAHQRQLLSDPNNLPYQTDIEINELKFALTVSAQMDTEGNYIGNTLEWMDVTDLRAKEELNNDYALQIGAISKAQGVIEFNMDGTIITANENFLNVVGYGIDEIRGKHHSMFADDEYKNSIEYRQFWEGLNEGNYDDGLYERLGKNGKKIWIQASYNPIVGLDGKPYKVVKYAIDVTEEQHAQAEVRNLIDLASEGKLDQRIDTSNYSGAVKEYAVGINNLLDAIENPVESVTGVAKSLADGDLTKQVLGDFKGQFAILGDSVNTSITNLLNMVNEIRTGADSINTSANEIAQGNLNLSQRTEEQASSLEETASSIEQLTGTVKQNADNAQQANQLASGARTEAEKGGAVVGNAIEAMSEINQASKKIADIIGVIDEIAFQTNLLALNAAVEAARAGEQGRGFAVVAAEVRNLAQRSAGAAKEIKTLINDSVQKVEEGSRLVDESGSTLEEIVNSVKKVSDIIAEIAAASAEQSAGIDQINKAVSQMDEMTQQNASLVEEAASASESMDEQAKGLTDLMNFFETGEGTATQAKSETERRSNDRPWSAEKSQSAAAPAKVESKVASGGGDIDSEWEEF